ncbi:hypothetical protein L21SP5_02996 [Salinivirga cyanobacteriivorans]|uniref:Uncharacterized protein n=1 Tax=Salinivirga cyanobacteriivorans TaxID=1307839 RepID=A0A0S2I2E9_9BACT|nr:hypothetical protein L21SP5_02996 [Salinivirga cyanobacteriivorans]
MLNDAKQPHWGKRRCCFANYMLPLIEMFSRHERHNDNRQRTPRVPTLRTLRNLSGRCVKIIFEGVIGRRYNEANY